MNRATENKIILITRKTRLQELVIRYNTLGQAQFFVESHGGDFSDYLNEDARYWQAVKEAVHHLERLGRVQAVDREFVPNFIFGEQDMVVVVGQDGLVANTLKYLGPQCLIGVNPDPGRWDGILLPFRVKDLPAIVPEAFKGRRSIKEVSMAKAVLNDGQILYAVNDLYIGQRTHVSSRYQIQLGEICENQSSSGIIVSTGLGSTGWMKSVLTGAAHIISAQTRLQSGFQPEPLPWNTTHLLFSVREPFPSRGTGTNLVFGSISEVRPLQIRSQMAENGVIFSDGIENDYLQFNAGLEATITLAEKKGHLVV